MDLGAASQRNSAGVHHVRGGPWDSLVFSLGARTRSVGAAVSITWPIGGGHARTSVLRLQVCRSARRFGPLPLTWLTPTTDEPRIRVGRGAREAVHSRLSNAQLLIIALKWAVLVCWRPIGSRSMQFNDYGLGRKVAGWALDCEFSSWQIPCKR